MGADSESLSVVRRLARRARGVGAALAGCNRRPAALVHGFVALYPRRRRHAESGGSGGLERCGDAAAALARIAWSQLVLSERSESKGPGIMSDPMTVETLDTIAPARLADELLASVSGARAWQNTIERLRALRRLPGRKPGIYALHETIGAARPAFLAAAAHALGGTLLVVVSTPDVAERDFADLLYYLGERGDRVALLRSRDEAVGAIETPSERSARMTLLAELTDGRPKIVLAPIAAARQHMMARSRFVAERFVVRSGDEPGWDRLQERLFALGYARSDVVSAVGEYAVRGGIIDVFAATAEAPVRIEFFGDRIESMRAFAIESQRSSAPVDALTVAPWSDAIDAGAPSALPMGGAQPTAERLLDERGP